MLSVSRIGEAGASMGASGEFAMALIERVCAGAGSGVEGSIGSTGGIAKCHGKFITSDCALEAKMRRESKCRIRRKCRDAIRNAALD